MMEKIFELKNRMELLKVLLHQQDYKTIKYMQGVLSKEEFAEVCEQCQSWRKEINEIEAQLLSLGERL